MEIKKSFIVDFAASTILSFLGCIVIGYLFFQDKIFLPYAWTFQFVIAGLIGALLMAYITNRNSKQLLFFVLVVFIYLVLFEKTFRFWFVLKDVFFNFSIFLSIKLYLTFIIKNKSLQFFLRTFGLSFIYALVNVLVGLLFVELHIIFESSEFGYIWGLIFIFAQSGALIGLGLGLGFDLWELIKKKFVIFT